MNSNNKINIKTGLGLSQLKENIEKAIDFKYQNKIGTIEIDEKYYGDKITDRRFRVWRKHDFRQGLLDIGFTSHFFVEINENLLTLELNRNWIIRIIVYIIISIIAVLITIELAIWPIWLTGILLPIILLFHHIISNLTDQSIKDDFNKISGNNST